MLQIGNAIMLLLFNRNNSGKTELFRAFLSGLAVLLVIICMLAILSSALLLAIIVYMHNSMLISGVNAGAAIIITSFVIILIISVILIYAKHKISKLQELTLLMAQGEHPISSGINHIFSSFFDGLLNKKNK